MGLFVMYGLDKPESMLVRAQTRASHLQWMDSLGPKVKLAGPLLGPMGEEPIGSLIIVEADDLEAARALFNDDPYARAQLWDTLDIRPFKQVRP